MNIAKIKEIKTNVKVAYYISNQNFRTNIIELNNNNETNIQCRN